MISEVVVFVFVDRVYVISDGIEILLKLYKFDLDI